MKTSSSILKKPIRNKRGAMKSRIQALVILIVLSQALLSTVLDAQTVVQRKRLGNNTEAMTAIHAGPLKNYIAIMDGTDVLAFANGGQGDAPVQKLFSVLGLGTNVGPRGIAYIDAEQLFVFDDPSTPDLNTLFLSDNHGRPKGTIQVTYPDGFVPDDVEALVWLPPTASKFGNHILQVVVSFATPTPTVKIEVIDRSTGQVVSEIIPNITLANPADFIDGLGFQSPDQLIVGATDGTLWQMDFSGNVLRGPVSLPNVADIESIAQTDNNRIAVAGYNTGKLTFLDGNLNPLFGQDRSFLVGFGLSQSYGVAWDTDLQRHLVMFPGSSAPSDVPQIVTLPLSLGSERQLVNLSGVTGPRALSYMPEEHRIALSQFGCSPNCAIFLYDNQGNLTEQVPVGFGLFAMTYVPTTKQFVGAKQGDLTTLLFVARDGTPVNSIDLTPIGIDQITAITFFNPNHPTGGEFLLFGSPDTHQAFVIDFTGKLLQQFDYKNALGAVLVRDLSTITSGPPCGVFSLVSQDTSEIVIFTLGK